VTDDLEDKVALITGASRGIGAAIAIALAERGAKVVINYLSNEKAAKDVERQIVEKGGVAVTIQGDVGKQADVRALIEQTVARFGRIDILVNNAAMMGPSPHPEIDPEYFRQMFDANVLGPIMMTQNAVPHFPEAGGRIINISSRTAFGGGPVNMVLYASAKAAVRRLTHSFAKELGPRNITVNCVAPGMTETQGIQERLSSAYRESTLKQTPLGRIGLPEDIAPIVAFLASDDARWLTGRTLLADGGMNDYW